MSDINFKNRFSIANDNEQSLELFVELSSKGVEKYLPAKWPNIELYKQEDDTGFLKGNISRHEINFFSDYFIGFGGDAVVIEPIELINGMKEKLNNILMQYINPNNMKNQVK